MAALRCPGQDMRFWKPDDVAEYPCPHCGHTIEFWKDDIRRLCPHCKKPVRNPEVRVGCAEWCQYAGECEAFRAPVPRPEGYQPQEDRTTTDPTSA